MIVCLPPAEMAMSLPPTVPEAISAVTVLPTSTVTRAKETATARARNEGENEAEKATATPSESIAAAD